MNKSDLNAWKFKTKSGREFDVLPDLSSRETNWKVRNGAGFFYFHTKKETKTQLEIIDARRQYLRGAKK